MWIKQIWIYGLCILLILSGCSRPGTDWDGDTDDALTADTDDIKKSYIVQTTKLNTLGLTPSITKTGKLIGESDVSVTAQAGGRVRAISFAEWDVPAKGAVVMVMDDSNNQFNYAAQRAKEWLDAARLNYQSSKINLENSLVDLELNLKNAQQQYTAARADAAAQLKDNEQQLRDTEQQLKDNEQQLLDAQQQIRDAEQQRIQAEYAAKTNDPDAAFWSANLQLQKFDSDIKKAEFDFETRLAADQQTLQWFVNSAEVLQDQIVNLYADVVDSVDKILGVSDQNRLINDNFEQFLSVQDTSILRQAQTTLRTMLLQQNLLGWLGLGIDQIDQIPAALTQLDDSLDQLDILLDLMDAVLLNSTSGSVFPQTQLDGLIAQINGLQSQVNGQANGIVSQINGIEAFVTTYVQNQQSLAKNIEILKEQRLITQQQLRDAAVAAEIAANRAEIWWDRTEIAVQRTSIWSQRADIAIQRTKIWLERANLQSQNAVTNAELSLESAQNALTANQKTKSVTLASLQNAIDQAQIAYNETVANASKLTVTAPIQWSISDVYVDVWEEVNPGTPLFAITNTDQQEVVITLSSAEKDQITKGKNVTVLQWDNTYQGTISSISNIADAQLLYKTTIKLNQLSDRLGDVVRVQIPLSSPYTLLPLQSVTMRTSKTGSIRFRNGQQPEQIDVELGDVRGTSIEIRSDLWSGLEIITSAMGAYDANIHDAQKESVVLNIQARDEVDSKIADEIE